MRKSFFSTLQESPDGPKFPEGSASLDKLRNSHPFISATTGLISLNSVITSKRILRKKISIEHHWVVHLIKIRIITIIDGGFVTGFSRYSKTYYSRTTGLMPSPRSHSNNFYFWRKFRLNCLSTCSLNQNSHNVRGAKELLVLIHLEIQNHFFSWIASIKTFFQSLTGHTFNLLRNFLF